jgi:phospholipid/cholesterol/gamma-HCH transport system substrate-binding protein
MVLRSGELRSFMKKYSFETSVGIMVFVGLLCVAYLTIKLGKLEIMGGDYYVLKAHFTSVAGLKPGSAVDMAGVQIGKVGRITLDQKDQNADVALEIRNGIVVTDDAIVSVKTSGLIGDKYIRITPGGSDQVLKNGDTVMETESAIDLEDLVSKYIFGSAK